MPNNPTYNLTGKYPGNTYSNLLQYDLPTNSLFDGLGNKISSSINFSSSYSQTNVYVISSSFASSSVSSSYASSSTTAINLGQTAYNISVTYASRSVWATSSSYSSSSLSSSYAPFTETYQVNTISASYASSSTTAGIATTATNLEQTAYSISVTYASQSNWSVSSSFASSSVSSSYAITAQNVIGTIASASYALSSLTASFALNGGGSGTTLATGSTYPITSSWALNSANGGVSNGGSYNISSSWASSSLSALSASYAPGSPSISASYALTASFAMNMGSSGSTTTPNTWTETNRFTKVINVDRDGIRLFGNPTYLVFEGDSLTSGVGSGSYVNKISSSLSSSNATLLNHGLSSSTIDTVISRLSTIPSASAGIKGYFSCMIGINDIMFNGTGIMTGPQSWFDKYIGYIQNVKDAGYSACIWTIAKANSVSTLYPNQEATRSLVNNLIKSSSIPDYVIDCDLLIPNTSHDYYLYASLGDGLVGDGLHFNSASNNILGSVYTNYLVNGNFQQEILYKRGEIYSEAGFVGNGNRLTTLNGSQITTGTVPTTVLPVTSIVLGGSNTSVISSSTQGVTSYTVSTIAASSPSSFLNKRIEMYGIANSAVTIFGFTNSTSGGGVGTTNKIDATNTTPYYYSYDTYGNSGSFLEIQDAVSTFIPVKPATMCFIAKLTNPSSSKAILGTAQYSAIQENGGHSGLAFFYNSDMSSSWALFTGGNNFVWGSGSKAIADTDFHAFKIESTSTTANAYIDDVLIASTSSLNIDTPLHYYWGASNRTANVTSSLGFIQFYAEQSY